MRTISLRPFRPIRRELGVSFPQPTTPLSLAGFTENYRLHFLKKGDNNPTPFQEHYLACKADLELRLSRCARDSANCHPHIKAYANMVELAKKISDRKIQAAVVNAFVNSAIKYDDDENTALKANDNLAPRSQVAALLDGCGICGSISQLKLAALELICFPQDDIRLVGMSWAKEEQSADNHTIVEAKEENQSVDGHAVVEVRIGNANWILNNESDQPAENSSMISLSSAQDIFIYHSLMERDFVAVNGDVSVFGPPGEKAYPAFSFNSTYAAYYNKVDRRPPFVNQSLPAIADNISPSELSYSLPEDMRDPVIERIMRLAFSFHGIEISNPPAVT